MRIAMWSGPRNLSTAMMYAFAQHPDIAVWDEPFYAPYLAHSGVCHPMQDDILAQHETDPSVVADRCLGPIPSGKAHFYMKHMPHHMLPQFPLDWATGCVNVHLIRHPARVIASYAEKRGDMTLQDLGYPQQTALFQRFPGPVINSVDIRADPKAMLRRLCTEIGLDFRDAMLAWPQGGRREDGIWARHWYAAIHRSTGFAGPEGPMPRLGGAATDLLAEALPHYSALAQHQLRP